MRTRSPKRPLFNANPYSRVVDRSPVKICGMASTTELLAQGKIKPSQIRRFPEGTAAGIRPTTVGEELARQFSFAPNPKK